MKKNHYLLIILAAINIFALPVQAVEVKFKLVKKNIYAFIGETGARTYNNEALNNNIGLIVTNKGSILIDSGATFIGAKQIHAAAKKVTDKPILWVINTGGQDHRWLGNSYFKSIGAEIIAHTKARDDMKNRGGGMISTLKRVLKEKAEGTIPSFPTRIIKNSDEVIVLGEVVFELKHRPAHTPGDMMVWLPAQKVLFTGDVVYVNRMLGVLPISNTKSWVKALSLIPKLDPEFIIPGHGEVSNSQTVTKDSFAYLNALRQHMQNAVDEFIDINDAIKSFDSKPFRYLKNSKELIPGNSSRTYLEIESDF